MATKVTKSATKITLQDGSTVEVRPLNIKNLRKFMEVTQEFAQAKSEAEGLDLLVKACQIALAATGDERFEDTDLVEEILDIESITYIMKVAGGVDLDDPNPIAAGA